MSSDETPKIEPKIEPTLTVPDAPSIAPEARSTTEIIVPKTEPQAAKPEAPKVAAEAPSPFEPETIEPKLEAPTLPPAPQLAESGAIVPFGSPDPESEKPPSAPQTSRGRFALLAACVAIAASFGAIGGSFGIAKFGPMLAFLPPAAPAPAARDPMTDEIKALKDTVAQLRGTAKALNDNLASLKSTVAASTTAQNSQIGKIAETLDRVEKAQAEQKKAAAAQPAPETTGSIAQRPAGQATPVPMVLGDPPTTLKPPVLQDYVLRRVYDGAALIEGRNGIMEVEAGETAPGLGRIEAIKRQDGRWVVVTARGLIVGR